MSGLRESLDGIYQQYGRLTPRLIVDAARDPESPLHSQFEWDDAVAGEKYREQQASRLIRAVRVTEPDGPLDQVRIRAFHSVPRPDGQTYVPVDEVKQDPFTRELVVRQAEREWRAMYARYRHLGEFLDVIRKDLAG